MPTILEALNDAGLYEQATGLHVDVVVVKESMYKKILNMGMVEMYNWRRGYFFIPVNL